MTTLTLRNTKGTPLTMTEMDDNLTNLNTDKLEKSNNLSELTDAAAARANLGLGSIATLSAPSGTVVGTSDNQTLTTKTIALGDNTLSGTLAQFNAALTGADFASLDGSETLTNKTIVNATAISGIGAGFQNVLFYGPSSGGVISWPTALQIAGAKVKVTLMGGGGQGGGTAATAGHNGAGGGSGALKVVILTYVSGVNSISFTGPAGGSGAAAGAAGNNGGNAEVVYNGISYGAGGGGGGALLGTTGGAGGVSLGTSGTINIAGNPGQPGGLPTATNNVYAAGGDSPLGWGSGGKPPFTIGQASGTGYGSGGSGAHNVAATSTAGGSGAGGFVMFEW